MIVLVIIGGKKCSIWLISGVMRIDMMFVLMIELNSSGVFLGFGFVLVMVIIGVIDVKVMFIIIGRCMLNYCVVLSVWISVMIL